MNPRAYDRDAALRLLPLLDSIGGEILEREAAVRRLEEALGRLDRAGGGWSREADALSAELAVHKRELRLAANELDRLGCTLIGHFPPTIRIPGRVHSWLWQVGSVLPAPVGSLEGASRASGEP